MAYTLFDSAKPDATAQTLTQMGTSERNNFLAIRDAVIMGGGFYGWNLTAGTPADAPTLLTYAKGTERVKAAITWVGGKVTVAAYSYSSDSGATYSAIGTKTLTWDGSDNLTATTWS